MASGNINLRDPVLYRILHAEHPRTGKTWSIYPSYDFAHGQSDAIEGITHSICTLEFEDHRPLYDWFLANLPVPSHPHQYEFARLNLTHTVLSKRVLTELVRGGHVSGWDDPRMPTLAGLRRRGVPPEAIRDFVKRIGVAKANSVVDMGMLDFSIREHLNKTAQRRMAVLRPLKVVIENYPEGESEEIEARQSPGQSRRGNARACGFPASFSSSATTLWKIRRRNFSGCRPAPRCGCATPISSPAAKFVKDAAGEVVELRCTYDPATKGGNAPDGRKVKATMHWVSAGAALPAEVRLYNPLFTRASTGDRQFCRRDQSEFAGSHRRRARRTGIGGNKRQAPPCSSSARAISARIRTRRPSGWCSIAPSACATPGRKSPPAANSLHLCTSCAQPPLAMPYTPR